MKQVWIFLHTNHIGGAEKRFAGLWKALQEIPGNFNLVLKRELHQKLTFDPDLKESIHNYADHIYFLNAVTEKEKLWFLYGSFFRQYTNEGDLFHFVGEHPLVPTKKNKQVFSITQSSLKNLNIKGKLGHFAGVGFSDIIDVLDPGIYKTLRTNFFYKKDKIHLTTNSFCNVNYYYALPFSEKKDWLVFLGRFESMKQVVQLFKAIPSIYQKLKEVAKNDLHFYFFGYGSLENELKQMMEQEQFKKLPVTIEYNDKPNEVLSKSKIFFSVQLHNNYPSRSLIEAMSAGNIPLVTDVGQSKWLAKPEFSYYIPEHFSTDNLVKVLSELYSESAEALEIKSNKARQFVIKEHTIENMRDYYLNLYNK